MLRQGRAQRAAAGALVSLGAVAAPSRAELAALLFTSDPFLRVYGATALWCIDGRSGWLLRVAEEILDHPRGATLLALEHLAEVGPPAAPLLPKLVAHLSHPDEWHCVPVARAVWRISGNEDVVAPVLVAAARPRPSGLLALETLVELPPAAAAPLITRLREWIETDCRPRDIVLKDKIVADDERLMALCRALLGRLGLV